MKILQFLTEVVVVPNTGIIPVNYLEEYSSGNIHIGYLGQGDPSTDTLYRVVFWYSPEYIMIEGEYFIPVEDLDMEIIHNSSDITGDSPSDYLDADYYSIHSINVIDKIAPKYGFIAREINQLSLQVIINRITLVIYKDVDVKALLYVAAETELSNAELRDEVKRKNNTPID